MRIVDVIEAEATLDAEPVLVGRSVAAGDVKKLVVLDVISELAADTAIGTDAVDRAVRCPGKNIARVDQRRRHQRPGRTGLHAFAAGDTGGGAHRVVKIEHNFLAMAAAGHADHVIDLNFTAGTNTQIAMNAGVEINRHRRVRTIGRWRLTTRKAALRDLKPRRDLPQFGTRIVRQLARRLVGEQKFGHHLSRGLGAIGLGSHLHAGRRRADAARGQDPLAFDLDHADAAIAVGPIAGLRQIAQMRELDAETARGAENGLAGADVDLAVVDREALGCGLAPLIGGAAHRHAAFALDRAAGSALLIVSVTGRFLLVAIAHSADLALPMSQRFGQFIGKILYHAQQRVRRRLAQSAYRRIAHQHRQFVEERRIPRTFGHKLGRLFGADPARRTLAAALVFEEFHQIERHGLHIVLVRQDHNRVRPNETTVLFQRPEIERDIGHGCRQNAAGGATRQIALETVAIGHAAAEFVDQLANGYASRRELDAWIFHPTGHREAAETFAFVPAL